MKSVLAIARPYLWIVTVFVLLRFFLELVGPESIPWFDGLRLPFQQLTSEISVTRLLLVLPVFLALEQNRKKEARLGTLVAANSLYVAWAILLVMAVTLIDYTLQLGTHYGRSQIVPHLLGHLVELKGWVRGRPLPGGGSSQVFCASILMMGILSNLIAWSVWRLGRRFATPPSSERNPGQADASPSS